MSLHKFLFAQDDPIDNSDSSGNGIDEVMGSFAVSETVDAMPTLQLNSIIGSNRDYPNIHELIAAKRHGHMLAPSCRFWRSFPEAVLMQSQVIVIAEQHPNGGGHFGIVVGKGQASASAVGVCFGRS